MKKSWIIALALALMLTGCGGPEGGEVTPVKETFAPPQSQTEPMETEAPTEAPTENPLSLGRMEGGTYTNTYAGFACDLDESWTYYSAEELQGVPADVMEAMDGSQLADMIDKNSQLMDMMAENADTLSLMNVVYGKQELKERLATQLMTEEDMVDVMLAQKDLLTEAYTQAGIAVDSMEKVQVSFLGEDHWALKTHGIVQELDYYVLQVFNYKAGAYGVTLTCSSYVQDNTQAVLDLFYPVN